MCSWKTGRCFNEILLKIKINLKSKMSEDKGNDLFVTICFCCFHGYLNYIYLTWPEKTKATHWFSFNQFYFFFFFITSFDYVGWTGTTYSQDFILHQNLFLKHYSRLACFGVAGQAESSNIVSNTNCCVKCLFDHKTLTM